VEVSESGEDYIFANRSRVIYEEHENKFKSVNRSVAKCKLINAVSPIA